VASTRHASDGLSVGGDVAAVAQDRDDVVDVHLLGQSHVVGEAPVDQLAPRRHARQPGPAAEGGDRRTRLGRQLDVRVDREQPLGHRPGTDVVLVADTQRTVRPLLARRHETD
jgi:hypothetical protein